jgi:electron transfer flavoprotein beta subunit
MNGLHTIVCLKVVPRPEEVKVDPVKHTIDRAGVRSVINPPDMNALELALSLKDRHAGTVTLLSMGPPFVEPYLRLALMMGADRAVLLSDMAFAGSDTLATTYILAKAIEKIGACDLVLCGEESSDGATAQVPAGIAEWLDASQITFALDLEFFPFEEAVQGRRELRGGYEIVRSILPCVVSVRGGINEPRFLNYARRQWSLKEAPVEVWNAKQIQADPALIGYPGSGTSVEAVREMPHRERRKEFLSGSPAAIARQLAVHLKPEPEMESARSQNRARP